MKKIVGKKISEISNKKYRELYRKFNRDQYMLLHKGYLVHKYDFETFKMLYDEKRKDDLILKDSGEKPKQGPMARLLNESRVYTQSGAKAMAKSKGITTSEWKRKTIKDALQGKSTQVDNISLEDAARIRRGIFQYFLEQNDGNYDIAKAQYNSAVGKPNKR